MSRDPAGTQRQGLARGFGGFHGEARIFAPILGRIVEARFHDAPHNKMGQTQVDVVPLNQLFPKLFSVPILHPKVNAANGEDWTPEAGDLVVVSFLEGDRRWPVVIGFLPHPDNIVEAATADAPRHRRVLGETQETWTKDNDLVLDVGRHRTVHVGADETVTVEGKGTVTINGGDLTVHVTSGKVKVTASNKVELDGGSGSVKGVVQGDCICPFIRKPHLHISNDVKASRG